MDFGLTAAISLLKWVVKNNITKECKIVSETGKIPVSITQILNYSKNI